MKASEVREWLGRFDAGDLTENELEGRILRAVLTGLVADVKEHKIVHTISGFVEAVPPINSVGADVRLTVSKNYAGAALLEGLDWVRDLVKIALELEQIDCGDNSCVFAAKKTGMRTNGGCRCIDKPELRRIMHRLAFATRKLPPEARLFAEEVPK
jgi:hypothetical protein